MRTVICGIQALPAENLGHEPGIAAPGLLPLLASPLPTGFLRGGSPKP